MLHENLVYTINYFIFAACLQTQQLIKPLKKMKTKTILSVLIAAIASPLWAQQTQQMQPDSLETAAGLEALTLQMVHEIGAVAVSASPITREADRYVMSVGNSTALAGLDGAELLTRTPGVMLSDDRISINGAAGAKIFIDGRELKGSTEETVAYLRTLTSGDVSRIEVVPQGGAQYSADSRGGVILISLRKRYQDGLEGHPGTKQDASAGQGRNFGRRRLIMLRLFAGRNQHFDVNPVAADSLQQKSVWLDTDGEHRPSVRRPARFATPRKGNEQQDQNVRCVG